MRTGEGRSQNYVTHHKPIVNHSSSSATLPSHRMDCAMSEPCCNISLTVWVTYFSGPGKERRLIWGKKTKKKFSPNSYPRKRQVWHSERTVYS